MNHRSDGSPSLPFRVAHRGCAAAKTRTIWVFHDGFVVVNPHARGSDAHEGQDMEGQMSQEASRLDPHGQVAGRTPARGDADQFSGDWTSTQSGMRLRIDRGV